MSTQKAKKDTNYTYNIKRSLLFALGGMLFVMGIFLFSNMFFSQKMPLSQNMLISFKFALAVFLPILSVGIFFSSILEVFRGEGRSKQIASLLVFIGISLFTLLLYSVTDRISWANRVDGMISTKLVSKLKNKEACKKSMLVEYAPEKKYIVFRCGGIFYPFYNEYKVTEKEFVEIVQNITMKQLQKGK